jgi:predicted RNA binding protein YcfA (HicA-like mRNA interferase family)
VNLLSQWDKLISEILKPNKNLRYEELAKAMVQIGYTQSQPSKGSSHFTFRKENCTPVTLPKPKGSDLDIVYIKLVRDAVAAYLSEGGDEK